MQEGYAGVQEPGVEELIEGVQVHVLGVVADVAGQQQIRPMRIVQVERRGHRVRQPAQRAGRDHSSRHRGQRREGGQGGQQDRQHSAELLRSEVGLHQPVADSLIYEDLGTKRVSEQVRLQPTDPPAPGRRRLKDADPAGQ